MVRWVQSLHLGNWRKGLPAENLFLFSSRSSLGVHPLSLHLVPLVLS